MAVCTRKPKGQIRANSELKSCMDDPFKDPGPALSAEDAHDSVKRGLLITTTPLLTY